MQIGTSVFRLRLVGVLLLVADFLWIVVLYSLRWYPVELVRGEIVTVIFPRDLPDRLLLVFLAMRALVSIGGAISLIRRTSFRFAYIGAVLASLPFVGPFMFLGIPIGLWALFELRLKDSFLLFNNRKPWT